MWHNAHSEVSANVSSLDDHLQYDGYVIMSVYALSSGFLMEFDISPQNPPKKIIRKLYIFLRKWNLF